MNLKFIRILLFSFILVYLLYLIIKNPSKQTISCPDCNVVFVSFDTLRADHLHFMGYSKNTSPTLDKLARDGFVFTNTVSASSWTLPATMSWFTGVYPSVHQILNKYTLKGPTEQEISNLKKLSPGLLTMAEILQKDGYKTGGFTGGAGVSHEFGFAAGFDEYIDNQDFAGFEYSYPKAIDWINKNRNKKLFVFLHGYNIHGQYVPPGGYDFRFLDLTYKGKLTGSKEEQLNLREEGLAQGKLFLTQDDVRFLTALYDEKIARADEEFSKFYQKYKKLGLLEKTIFVITSDHGEELYDHGQIDHGHSLYQEVIHVPLLIIIPGIKGALISQQVRSIDLLPTILTIIGAGTDKKIFSQFQGKNLTDTMKGDNLNLQAFSETDYRYAVFKRAIISADSWKYITDLETKENILYNLKKDQNERNNLIGSNLLKENELNKRLKEIMEANKRNN